jgi:TolB protein
VNPSWAPDGSAFVFASERAGKLHLFKADAGGGGVERLTFVGSQNDNPAWSPKGDKIAFQSLAGGWDIFVMNTDGSQIQRLTSMGNCESPTWAPNGRFIAASCGGRVVVMREDGSNVTPVGPGGSHQPSWGPWEK